MYTYLNNISTGYYKVLCNFRMCHFWNVLLCLTFEERVKLLTTLKTSRQVVEHLIMLLKFCEMPEVALSDVNYLYRGLKCIINVMLQGRK